MSDLLTKAQVVLGAAITYIVAVGVGLSAASAEISEAAPPGWEDATAWLVRAVALLGTAVVVIRRVTEVAQDLRGLELPADTVLKLVTEHPDGRVSTVEKVA